ncbi:hypothetical protein [Streptomyces mangrovisoli]|uniref:Uncharacterized protein n=1 Tax=Streptomyces mangrovisoli TaxID=1428628 RepID=A0A1J4NRT2_9ACTN|nr:hypothetical protein [Streptomyces mangrovisoli]OIJ64292.1 hypothetical protein WN71_029490 [Streptomyces mangrovisoli]
MYLGPLERAEDGHWVLGDPLHGAKGGHVNLLPEGAEHWWRGTREVLVPWARFMSMDGLAISGSRVGSSRAVGFLNSIGGGGPVGILGPCWTLTLRHPYEVWVAQISHHERHYHWAHRYLLDELLGQLIGTGRAHLLGDADWLASVVEHLAPQRPFSAKAIKSTVAKAIVL